MKLAKRIALFFIVNILVITTISLILSLFNVRPYLTAYGLDYKSLAIFCLIWGMVGSLISLALSKQMAKWMMGVKIIDPNKADSTLRALLSQVHNLCQVAGMNHMPEVGIYESNEPNAFATGPSEKRSMIALSTGLLNRMSSKELEGVIAHEISHITNGDMITMTLLQGIINAFVMFLARVLAFAVSNLGRSKDESPSFLSYTLFTYLFEVVFMVFGLLVITAFSRYREFRADEGGASIAGKDKMIAALEALQRMQNQATSKKENSFAMLQISSGKKRGLSRFFSSHPPLQERIERLKTSL